MNIAAKMIRMTLPLAFIFLAILGFTKLGEWSLGFVALAFFNYLSSDEDPPSGKNLQKLIGQYLNRAVVYLVILFFYLFVAFLGVTLGGPINGAELLFCIPLLYIIAMQRAEFIYALQSEKPIIKRIVTFLSIAISIISSTLLIIIVIVA